jgi:hypothetical protein
MADCVSDTSRWEKWQRDYGLGLILIMPPHDVARQINPLRSRYDPKAYASCPAHITLSDPLGLEMTTEFQRVKSYPLGTGRRMRNGQGRSGMSPDLRVG